MNPHIEVKGFLAVLLVLLFTMHTPEAKSAEIPLSLIKRVQPAVVTVLTYDAQGKELGQGTGFFINAKGHLITNFHVLMGAQKAKVKTNLGTIHEIKQVLAEDRLGDLIMVSVEISGNVQELRVTGIIPKVGERVVVVGSPLGYEQTISEGIFSSVRDVEFLGGKRLQISAPISKGSSGGPVVNLQGEVVGVAEAISGRGQNINFAIPGERVLRLKPIKSQSLANWNIELTKEWLKSEEGVYWTGVQYFWRGDYQKAISYFEEAGRKNPKFAEPWFAIGGIYYLLAEGNKAISAFEKGLSINPNWAAPHVALGTAYENLGRHQEAIDAYKRALRVGNLGANEANVHFLLGISYTALRHWQEAADAYEKGIRLKPIAPEELCQLGRIYALLANPKAAEAWKRAIWLKPDLVDAHFWLSYFYFVTGDKKSSLNEFKIVEQLDPRKARELESLMNQPPPTFPF